MKTQITLFGFVTYSIIIVFIITSCDKNETELQIDTEFKMSSPAIGSDSLLPITYTCDGESMSPPIDWYGAPGQTSSYVILMDHIAALDDIHWYWILYNIPSDITCLQANTTGIGLLGTNSVNDQCEYAPPCSQGPGEKAYKITIYALSNMLEVPVYEQDVDRSYLLNAIQDITISSTSITVYYSREIK